MHIMSRLKAIIDEELTLQAQKAMRHVPDYRVVIKLTAIVNSRKYTLKKIAEILDIARQTLTTGKTTRAYLPASGLYTHEPLQIFSEWEIDDIGDEYEKRHFVPDDFCLCFITCPDGIW